MSVALDDLSKLSSPTCRVQGYVPMRDNSRMATDPAATAFNDQLCARVRLLRKERFANAEEMAEAIGIPVERNRKYEVRTPMPHYLIPRFARIVGREIEFVLTGRANKMREPLRAIPGSKNAGASTEPDTRDTAKPKRA